MKLSISRTALRSAALVLAGAVISGSAVYVLSSEESGGNSANGPVSYSHFLSGADYSVDANLTGEADHVFFGKVKVKKGQRDLGVGPETQYAVVVERVFKGELSGTVVVNQQGGVDEEGVLVLPENDHLLQEGSTYLFATKRNPDNGWNTLIPVYGDVPVPNTSAQAPGMPDANGDGQATVADRWVLAVKNQADLSTAPPVPEPTEMPAEDPPVEESPAPSATDAG
ncbi:hypothetical protein GCM10009730_64980 [Streptomyces albidochromogenes]|uniref:hypothetical protein n=1 Tax=Streptomyces albidochromogenes TaxID=329524 RepID=UPI00110FCE4D|nr:hypothetical protein [Streptomyces albidochromogenes]